jgi:anti-anti-sigma factor
VTEFDVLAHTGGGVTRLELCGEMDIAVVGIVSEAIRQALGDATTTELVVDVAAVTFLDSTGIGALMTGHKSAQARGAAFRVINAHGSVDRVLRLTGVLAVLTGAIEPAAS